MSDIQIKLRQRVDIMKKVCELAEASLPEEDKTMPLAMANAVDEIYQLLSQAMEMRAKDNWFDDDIDTTDIAEADEKFFKEAKLTR